MRTLQISLVAVMLAACGTDPAPDNGPLDPAPPEGGQQLATTTYRLQPGEEKYMCYQFYSPADAVAITRIESISAPGIHHIAVYQAFGRNEEDAPHECAVVFKQTWLPILGSGTGTHELDLPAGTGFVIQPETQYIVQLHLQNTGDEALDIRGGVNLTYEHDVASVTQAGLFAMGTFNLSIPANTTNYQVPVTNCNPGMDMHVFGAFPHMHKLGTKIEVTRTTAATTNEPFYKMDPWDFSNQPLDNVDVVVSPTDTFDLRCTYTNPTSQAVTYGESSDNEMCFFVFFYYPFDHLDACLVQ